MSLERRRVMAVLGAELVLTEAAKGMPGAIAKAKEIADSDPSGTSCRSGQPSTSPEIQLKATGPEIWNDSDGAIDVLVAGVGTQERSQRFRTSRTKQARRSNPWPWNPATAR